MYSPSMVTSVFCYDPIKLQQSLGFVVQCESNVPPLLTLLFTTTQHASTFFYEHLWMMKYMGVDLLIDCNLIHVHVNDEKTLCSVLGYFYLFYRPIAVKHEVIKGVVYSSITWSDIPVRI